MSCAQAPCRRVSAPHWIGRPLFLAHPPCAAALHGDVSLAQEGDRRMIVPKGKVEIENTGLGRALSLKKSYDAIVVGTPRISKEG